MTASVHLRWVRRWHEVRDHLIERACNKLGYAKRHTHSDTLCSLGLTSAFSHAGYHGQVHDAFDQPEFRDQIAELNRRQIASQFPIDFAELNCSQLSVLSHNDPRLFEMQARLAPAQIGNCGLPGGDA